MSPLSLSSKQKAHFHALESMNELFYRHYANAFHSTREYGWRGWRALLNHLGHQPSRILDIACGGGRFADFLQRIYVAEQGAHVEAYLGLERSEVLLKLAQERSLEISCEWRSFDWSYALTHGKGIDFQSDWTVLFGVMHHVYSFEARVSLVVWAAHQLNVGGVISLSLWSFGASQRYEKKYLSWESSLTAYHDLSEELIEPGDHLLGWSGESHIPRYCHWLSPMEESQWLQEIAVRLPQLSAPQLTVIDGDMNRYWSWQLLSPVHPA